MTKRVPRTLFTTSEEGYFGYPAVHRGNRYAMRDTRGRLIANFQLFKTKDVCNLDWIEVSKEYQGRGLGKVVFSEAYRIAKEDGCALLKGEMMDERQVQIRKSIPGTRFYDMRGNRISAEVLSKGAKSGRVDGFAVTPLRRRVPRPVRVRPHRRRA